MFKNKIIKALVLCVILGAATISGCLGPSEVGETMPEDVLILQISPALIRLSEGETETINVVVANNGSGALEELRISSLSGFALGPSGGGRNVAAKKEGEEIPSVKLSTQVTAPRFKDAPSNATLVLTYKSNGDKMKSVDVPIKILPNAKLQYVGFAATEDRIRHDQEQTITTEKSGTIYVTFSTKNEGESTIDGGTLKVMVDVKEDAMGKDNESVVKEGMARKGTSYTLAVPITIPETAPNGETDVYVSLVTTEDEEVLDGKIITLIVKL